MDCAFCGNTNCIIKKNLENEKLKQFLHLKNELKCNKGQTFILEGGMVHGLYFIQDGTAKIAKTGLNGKQQIVRFATNGETVGYRGFGSGKYYQINATATQNTYLCHFSNETFHQILMSVPQLTFDLMTFYADELSRSETKVKKLAQMTVREKVIDTLLYIYRKFGQHKNLNITLSRSEISDYAGTTQEQVIRVLSSLKKEGLITTQKKSIMLKDVELLRKEIAEHNYFQDS